MKDYIIIQEKRDTEIKLSEKDRIIKNRLQTAESYINYTLKEIDKDKTCKNIRNILQETINVLNTAKDIVKSEYWYI